VMTVFGIGCGAGGRPALVVAAHRPTPITTDLKILYVAFVAIMKSNFAIVTTT
jgi:predicted proteasome-type protease